MMKTTSLVLALVSAVSMSLGCSSSSSSPTSDVDSGTSGKEDSGKGGDSGGSTGAKTSTGCVQGSKADMDQSCALFDTTGFTSGMVTSLNANCTKDMGTVVTTCPTADLVGCCTTMVEGSFSQVTCTYSGTAADGKSACTAQSGTWSTTQ